MNSEQLTLWLSRHSDRADSIKKPLIMGILNVTPDSFSDGGNFVSTAKACEHALAMIDQGADLIDIGGESTKPGALSVPLGLELDRVIPVIEAIRVYSDVCISVDTYKPELMKAAVAAGADVINDIYALRQEGALTQAAALNVPVCLTHMQGNPSTMQQQPYYKLGVVNEVNDFFAQRIKDCVEAGIDRKKIILDPGFGFGKQVQDNLKLLQSLEAFLHFKQPILLGVSRKSTIGLLLDKKVDERLIGSTALNVYAALKGAALLRTHDVDETHQAMRMINAVEQL